MTTISIINIAIFAVTVAAQVIIRTKYKGHTGLADMLLPGTLFFLILSIVSLLGPPALH